MAAGHTALDTLIDNAGPALAEAEGARETTHFPSMRELFLELLVVSLGNLYGKMPLPSTLYDRSMMKVIIAELDDTDASKLTGRSEDWMRQEGIVRAAEGQKAYILNRPSFAVLSTATAEGTLGEVMERISRCYAEQKVTPELRRATRELGAHFMSRVARS